MIEVILQCAAILYLIGTALVMVFVSGFAILLVIYAIKRRQQPTLPSIPDNDLLSVTVQIPIYNESAVIDRLLDACAFLNYPAEKLHIQVIDDSTDDTPHIVQQKIAALGLPNISHLRRTSRTGYKAGALEYGLSTLHTECVVIFDADFVPEPDFLRRTMPYFSHDPALGLIQTRWEHLNPDYNLLTRAQALSIDAHFGVEQVARNRGKLPMAMNGTGGIWRTAAITDSGGWSADTLTEDLDLSYRAFLRGWEFLYLVDVTVPGELPPLIQVFKEQQARWATGSTQCLVRHMRALIFCARCSPLKRLMGLLHLSQYAVQPLILLLFLLTPVLLAGNYFTHLPDMRIIALFSIIPPLVVAVAQMELHADWRRRLLFFPVQFVTSAAIVLSNSVAVFSAIWRPAHRHVFQRTPKFRISNTRSPFHYGVHIDPTILGEFLLAFYAGFGVIIALNTTPQFAPYLMSYALSFSIFAAWNLYQKWKFRH